MNLKHHLAAAFLLLCASFAQADTVTAAGDPWPPFLDPEHAKQGVAVEIVAAALASQGHTLKFSFMPWQRALDGVKEGSIDILVGAWHTQEREAYLLFGESYLSNDLKFIKRKDDAFAYTGIDSLKGKTIGTVRGYGYGDAFEKANNFKKQEAAELMPSILKLVGGRIDLTLEDEVVARSLISKNQPDALDKLAFVDPPLSSNPLHIAAGQKNPNKAKIIEAFNKGLAEIKGNGTLDEILSRNGLK